MKKYSKILLLMLLSPISMFGQSQNEPVLMTINGRNIPKSYFDYIYFKNNAAVKEEQKTPAEYLELFKVFELKVTEALAQGMDTLGSFKSELEGYRRQLAAPLLTDDARKDSLVREAYERMKENVDVSHILVMIDGKGTPDDTLAAYEKALKIEKRLKKEPFEKVAREMSDDKSVQQNGGHLGYLSSLLTVYPFETAAYTTPTGKISAPVRTRFGYHILKVGDRRENRKVLVSHILKFTNDTLPEKNKQAEQSIRSLYEEAKSGKDFGTLARENSDDKSAELWVEVGKMVPEFENAAFELKEKGDISQPFKSRYGWHIVKLIDTDTLASFDKAKDAIERQILRSDRAELIANSFIDKLKKQYDFRFDEKNFAYLAKLAREADWNDSLFFENVKAVEHKFGKNSLVLFSYCDHKEITINTFTSNRRPITQTYINDKRDFATFGDFIAYMQKKKLPSLSLNANIDSYVKDELTALKNKSLETDDANFRNLMQEYHDGILLFNVCNKEVWEKAATDSAGLSNYYKANKSRYQWDEPRYKGQVFYCKDKKIAMQVRKILGGSADSINVRLKRLNKDSIVVKTSKGLFKQGANKAVDAFVFGTGEFQPTDGFKEVVVQGKILKKFPESYLDIKGLVTQDYQNELEERWVEMLRLKYPINVVLKLLNQK